MFWGWLKSFVRVGQDGINRVAYKDAKASGVSELDTYLTLLRDVAVSKLARSEQCAFWINLYNAMTLRLVIDHYPIRSIRDIDISPGIFSDGPWGAKLVRIEEQDLSLDDIEHRILRPIWQDPRLHYGLNCASLGCPNLQLVPFHGHRLEAQLDAAAMAFVNHPRGLRLENGRLEVSSIYKWFAGDFGGDERAIIKHLLAYVRPELAMELQKVDRIAGYSYDWDLNDEA